MKLWSIDIVCDSETNNGHVIYKPLIGTYLLLGVSLFDPIHSHQVCDTAYAYIAVGWINFQF